MTGTFGALQPPLLLRQPTRFGLTIQVVPLPQPSLLP